MVKWQGHGAAADGLSVSGVPRKSGGPADPHSGGVPRAASPLQGTADPGHGGVLRIGARRQPRAGGTGARDAPCARRQQRRRSLPGRACEDAQGARVGAVLRRGARAGAAAVGVDADAAVREPPLRRDVGRRPGHHGSGQPRRARGRRQDDRPEHPPAVRAGREPVHHRRAALRVSLFLHAQVLVRVSREGAGDLSRAASARWTSSSRS